MSRAIFYRPSGAVYRCSCCGPETSWDSHMEIVWYTDEPDLVEKVVDLINRDNLHAAWEIKLLPGVDDDAELEPAWGLEQCIKETLQKQQDAKKLAQEQVLKRVAAEQAARKEAQERQTYEALKAKFEKETP